MATATTAGVGAQGGTVTTQAKERPGVERTLRMWAGIVLMVFVATHLINHAIGVFGVDVMEQVQHWRTWAWRTWIGTVLLYGSLAIHIVFTLRRAVSRRTLRMPLAEALQIALGLAIPLLLWRHIVDSRVMNGFAHVEDTYTNLLRYYYPEYAWTQTALLLVVWVHGCIGIRFLLRHRPWFGRWRTLAYMMAVALPLLALAGFVSAGRESHKLSTVAENWNELQILVHGRGITWGRVLAYSVLGLPLLFLISRLLAANLRSSVPVRYVGHGDTKNPRGMTLLEMSRLNKIPHPSVCGGRGRCGTCRVLILSDADALPPPSSLERKLLDRIKAPQRVRLACQIRPERDLNVKVLLSVKNAQNRLDLDEEAMKWGQEREVAVLFADIRGFSTLARSQVPQDLVILLNRVIEDMTQAVAARGGQTAIVLTDGIMAVFGATGGNIVSADRAALRAAADILKAAEAANKDLGGALPQPLRVGIGVHSGPAIIAKLGNEAQGYSLSVIGDTVLTASRLEEATKELGADCVASQMILDRAGLKTDKAGTPHKVTIRNSNDALAVRAFADAAALDAVVNGAARATAAEPPQLVPVGAGAPANV